jgi:hypothetical protein
MEMKHVKQEWATKSVKRVADKDQFPCRGSVLAADSFFFQFISFTVKRGILEKLSNFLRRFMDFRGLEVYVECRNLLLLSRFLTNCD